MEFRISLTTFACQNVMSIRTATHTQWKCRKVFFVLLISLGVCGTPHLYISSVCFHVCPLLHTRTVTANNCCCKTFLLIHFLSERNASCISNHKPLATLWFTACDSTCASCFPDNPKCMSCPLGTALHHGKCISQCPTQHYMDNHSRCRGRPDLPLLHHVWGLISTSCYQLSLQ